MMSVKRVQGRSSERCRLKSNSYDFCHEISMTNVLQGKSRAEWVCEMPSVGMDGETWE